MAHGTPADARGDRGLLHPHPAGPAAAPEQLADLRRRYARHRRRVPAGRAHATHRWTALRRRARAVRARPLPSSRYGAKHTDAAHRGRGGRLVARGVRAGRRPRAHPAPSSMGSGSTWTGPPARGLGGGAASSRSRPGTTRRGSPTPGRRRAEARSGAGGAGRPCVVFTAHSLPERIVAAGDPYPEQLAESAAAGRRGGGLDDWRVAWQSAGPHPRALARARRARRRPRPGGRGRRRRRRGVPDRLRGRPPRGALRPRRRGWPGGRGAGLAFARTASLNDDPGFVGRPGRR